MLRPDWQIVKISNKAIRDCAFAIYIEPRGLSIEAQKKSGNLQFVLAHRDTFADCCDTSPQQFYKNNLFQLEAASGFEPEYGALQAPA